MTPAQEAAITARFDKIDERLTALFAVDTNGDGKRDITGTVQGAVRTELARVMSHLAAGSVDPVALAKAIAEHIDLVAK